jgi:hypothetical protein
VRGSVLRVPRSCARQIRLGDRLRAAKTDIATNLTLTGYDASGNPVPGATATGLDAGYNSVVLKITSASANIKYFTISTDDPLTNSNGLSYGLGFSNIVWS